MARRIEAIREGDFAAAATLSLPQRKGYVWRHPVSLSRGREGVVRVSGDDAGAWADMGRADIGLERTAEAVNAFRRAAELAPASAGAHMNLALALAATGALNEAEREYRAALTLAPNDAVVLSGLGRVLAAEGRRDEAVDAFRRALRLAPDNPAVREDLAASGLR